MGIYLNPGNRSFWKSIRSEIYVDKTALIACTNKRVNTDEQNICVSRPRRFGKSMALNMLAAYYSRGCDSADLFKGFQIEKDETFREHSMTNQKNFEDFSNYCVSYEKDSRNKPHSCVIEKMAYTSKYAGGGI